MVGSSAWAEKREVDMNINVVGVIGVVIGLIPANVEEGTFSGINVNVVRLIEKHGVV